METNKMGMKRDELFGDNTSSLNGLLIDKEARLKYKIVDSTRFHQKLL